MRLPSRVQSGRLGNARRAGSGIAGVSPHHMLILEIRGRCSQSILLSSCDRVIALWQHAQARLLECAQGGSR